MTPTKFSEDDAAALLARGALWAKLPTRDQLALYQYQDEGGAYFCAIQDCAVAGQPEHGKDPMATIGPLVFCHAHGKAVLSRLRLDFDAGADSDKTGGKRCQWYYLSRTLRNAEVRDGDVAEQTAEDGEEDWRKRGAEEEMTSRAERLEKTREWASRHRTWVAARKAGQEAEKAKAKEAAPAAGIGTDGARTDGEDRDDSAEETASEPDPNNLFLGKTQAELDEARATVLQAQNRIKEFVTQGDLDKDTAALQNAQFARALRHVNEAEAALRRAEEQKTKEAAEAAKEAAEAKRRAAKATLDEFLAKLGYKAPPVGPAMPASSAAPVRTTAAPASSGESVRSGGIQVACNARPEVSGAPHPRADLNFAVADFPDHFACDKALDETGGPWSQLLRDHKPEGVSDEDALRHGTEGNKQAKKAAKDCLMHGALAKSLAWFRGQVIQHYTAHWPQAWQERMKGTKRNGTAEREERGRPCAECGCKVGQLYARSNGGAPLNMAATDEAGLAAIAAGICGRCKKRGRNTERKIAAARANVRNSNSRVKPAEDKKGGGGMTSEEKKAAKDAAKRAARNGR
ncbi:hypothetical protein HYW17_05135 [Candidatus Uhrbacteria bacterium]|nr:hypothetical protein [Candidatus Uhrbacteria bacterium]